MNFSYRFGALLVLLSLSLPGGATTVDNELLANEADGTNWASYGRTFSENHYSPLAEINAGNIERLKLAWFYDLPQVSNVFSAPLAVDGVLYFAIGYSVIHAMDARTGKLLWRYDPQVPASAGHKMRGGWGIRGIAFWDGKVLTGTHDGRLIALDARDGKPLWSVQTLPRDDSSYITGPPWVFNGKVVIGQGGADFGPLRGYVTAYDVNTGKQLWRWWVVPGNPADGFENAAMEMAAKTWTGEWWVHGGGGTVWNAMAYDPKYNRLYLGTGNGAPVNQKMRSPGGGDNLFLSSIVALDADSGEYVWHYQANPGETWDFTNTMDIALTDLVIDGKPRSVLLHAPKNGFYYVIDRENGKLVSAEKFTTVTWAERIDLATGRPVETPEARYLDGKGTVVIPGAIGGHNVEAMSHSPQSGLSYIPQIDYAGVYADPPGDLSKWRAPPGMLAASQGIGAPSRKLSPPPITSSLLAWNPVTQQEAWRVPLTGMFNGAVMSTGGNLVFQGRDMGEFAAYAADSGKKLWSFDAQTGIMAQPISYMAGGRQYVTVIAGWRGMGNRASGERVWDYRTQPRRVLTFALDGTQALPAAPAPSPFVDDPKFVVDENKAGAGRNLMMARCGLCHGFGLDSGGAAPDLRKSAVPLSLEALSAVLLEGTLVAKGMPRYGEFTAEEIEGIQHYVRQQARAAMPAK